MARISRNQETSMRDHVNRIDDNWLAKIAKDGKPGHLDIDVGHEHHTNRHSG